MSRLSRVLRPHVVRELEAARSARRGGQEDVAWRYLERAHILSQPSAWLHTRVHLAMLLLALSQRDLRELLGQALRVAVAAVGSVTGRYPLGNTGRAAVPILEPMPVPADLAEVLRSLASPGKPSKEKAA